MSRLAFGVIALLASAQDASFRVDVNLVRVLATVKDAEGNLVGSLSKDRFRLLDSGVPQEIAIYERSTALPLSVAVLIDASGSTAKDLPAAVDAVRGFLRALVRGGNEKDAAALYAFNWEVAELSPFTRNLGRLHRGLKRLKGEAGTSLYDALIFAAQDLETREGRKVVVLVTDGGDTTSSHTFHDALRGAHLAEAIVYPILIVPVQTDAGRNIGGENALASVAAGTGGRVFQASQGPALGEAFATVLSDLRTQYLLGYYPRALPPGTGPFRRIRVEVLDGGRPSTRLRVAARSGYYEEARRGSGR